MKDCSEKMREILCEAKARGDAWMNDRMNKKPFVVGGVVQSFQIAAMSLQEFEHKVQDRRVTYGYATTGCGCWKICSLPEMGIFRVIYVGESMEHAFADEFPYGLSERTALRDDESAQHVIRRFLNGESGNPIKICMVGSPLQLGVWKALCEIPRGVVLSYKQVALLSGNPKAIRAVATCVGQNRMGWLVPCHRVIHQDGDVGQYYWGTPLKCRLLLSELKSGF